MFHGLDGNDKARFHPLVRARSHVIRDLWVLVHLSPGAVSDECPDHAKPARFHMRLNGIPEVGDSIARDAELDGRLEGVADELVAAAAVRSG